jgi:hypothetical protein
VNGNVLAVLVLVGEVPVVREAVLLATLHNCAL